MDLCISYAKKCDEQMFVTRTADANLKTGHDGLKNIENVKRGSEREGEIDR